MRSFARDFLDRLRFTSDQAAMLAELGRLQGRQELYALRSPELFDSLMHVAQVESLISSNRIEGVGSDLSDEEFRAIAERQQGSDGRSQNEVAGYRDALAVVHENHAGMEFSCGLLRQLHREIYKFLPHEGGEYKNTSNDVIETMADGRRRVRFRTVTPVETPAAMEEFERLYLEAIQPGTRALAPPLVAIPLAVLDFLCIHPFPDGNGRVARLLMLLLLYKAGYDVGRFVSLERVIEDSKETYYEALLLSSGPSWHKGEHDPYPWMEYVWSVLLASYRELHDQAVRVPSGRGSKARMVEDFVRRKSGGEFTVREVEHACPGVASATICQVLNRLRKQGKVELVRGGRGATWRGV